MYQKLLITILFILPKFVLSQAYVKSFEPGTVSAHPCNKNKQSISVREFKDSVLTLKFCILLGCNEAEVCRVKRANDTLVLQMIPKPVKTYIKENGKIVDSLFMSSYEGCDEGYWNVKLTIAGLKKDPKTIIVNKKVYSRRKGFVALQ